MRKIFYSISLIFVLFFILISDENQVNLKNKIENNNVEVKKEDNKENSSKIKNLYKVDKVVDGDTIYVSLNGLKQKVRLIGVNTPESVDPRKKVECFGKEASLFLKNLILDKNVYLEDDPSQGDKDKYGRILRYVYLDDLLVNKEIIEKGFGYEYTYQTPYRYKNIFELAEENARENKIGLWADGVCE